VALSASGHLAQPLGAALNRSDIYAIALVVCGAAIVGAACGALMPWDDSRWVLPLIFALAALTSTVAVIVYRQFALGPPITPQHLPYRHDFLHVGVVCFVVAALGFSLAVLLSPAVGLVVVLPAIILGAIAAIAGAIYVLVATVRRST